MIRIVIRRSLFVLGAAYMMAVAMASHFRFNDEINREKKENVIACGKNGLEVTMNDLYIPSRIISAVIENRNKCRHRPGVAGSACAMPGIKRRYLKLAIARID